MIANALIITIATLIALLFWLMNELRFLIPYKHIIVHQYGTILFAWLAIIFVNLFAAIYAVQRKFFLKDTGRKLSHVDHQLAGGHVSLPAPGSHPEEH